MGAMLAGRCVTAYIAIMTTAQIRIVVLDTTGPIDLLYVEEQRRDRAFAFHFQTSNPVSLTDVLTRKDGPQSHRKAARAFPALAAQTHRPTRKSHG